MIIVAGHITVEPQQRESYLADCVNVVEQARTRAGCLDFAITADLIDPGRVNVFERWESQTAVETFRGNGPSDKHGDRHPPDAARNRSDQPHPLGRCDPPTSSMSLAPAASTCTASEADASRASCAQPSTRRITQSPAKPPPDSERDRITARTTSPATVVKSADSR